MISDTCYTWIYVLAIILLATTTVANKWYILDKRNLFRQKLFWISVLTPLFSFIYFGLFTWWGKEPVLSPHGYSRFYEISKFPLLLLASAVPLASIVNNIHRTIQTEAQINTAEIKNAVDRYLSHEKNFIEKIKEILIFKLQNAKDSDGNLIAFEKKTDIKLYTSDELKISNPYHLYTKIYNLSTMETTSNFTPNPDFVITLKALLDVIDDALSLENPLIEKNSFNYMSRLNTVSNNTALLLDLINAGCVSHVYCLIKHENYKLKTFTNQEQMLADILEGIYQISRKLVRLIYNEEIPHYKNIYDYVYVGKMRFKFEEKAIFIQSFSSQEWGDYVSKTLIFLPESNGDIMAAEH